MASGQGCQPSVQQTVIRALSDAPMDPDRDGAAVIGDSVQGPGLPGWRVRPARGRVTVIEMGSIVAI
jgi:hypothetical protein